MASETPKKQLQKLLEQAIVHAGFEYLNPQITVPEPQFGDYATNAALIISKQQKKDPKETAEGIAEYMRKLDPGLGVGAGLFEVSVVGGFLNFTLTTKPLLQNLSDILELGDLYGASVDGGGRHVVVEYFQNNVAKPPHVGHLRSAVIGDCILRVLKFQGYKAVSDTHIGDWGVQFGILIFAYKQFIKNGGNKQAIEKDPIAELNKLYVAMSLEIEKNPDLREQGKEEFVKLEKGDAENQQLWQWFVDVSLEDFERYRQWLQVLPFDHNLGESFYTDKMAAVLKDLEDKGISKFSEGAWIVDLTANNTVFPKRDLGTAVLVKSDGGTTYLLRDLATVKYRAEHMNLYRALYVVDNRQTHHFEQVFEITSKAGYTHGEPQMCRHLDFGFMSLPEGAISTRKGTAVNLQAWLDEARKKALAIIEEKNPDLENKEAVAGLVGLSAIKYFDLSHNRKTEITFTWERAVSFEGNTGPYLQYAHARIYGILRKAGYERKSAIDLSLSLNQFEQRVSRKLLQFPEVISQVAEDFFPNHLCAYLFELAQEFNTMYEQVVVIQEKDEKVRAFRLQLIDATAQVLKNGLYLLGIEAPEEM